MAEVTESNTNDQSILGINLDRFNYLEGESWVAEINSIFFQGIENTIKKYYKTEELKAVEELGEKIIRDIFKEHLCITKGQVDAQELEELTGTVFQKFQAHLENRKKANIKNVDPLDEAILHVEPRLPPITPIPSSVVMFSSIEAYTRKDRWQKNEQGIACLQHRAKGNPQNYIEHYITNPRDITLLPWDEAQQIIDKFGFTTAKLHLVFAAHAIKSQTPWESQFHLKASDIIREFGWEKNHKKSKPEKLLEIAKTAFALDCLLVKAFWVEGKNKKGQIIASAPVGRMWNVYIKPIGQVDIQGKIDQPDEVYITVQPGLWTQDFLNRAGTKSREALYQFGYLAEQVLKIDPYHDELALRFAIYLTLDSRVRPNGNYKVQELLEIALAQSVIDKARSDCRKAYDLKQRWDSAIKLLLELEWQVTFDAETYPAWLRPDAKAKKPKGYLDKLLKAKLTIKPIPPIPELLASKVKPRAKSIKPKNKLKPSPPNSLTSSQVREARQAKGWTQAKLAGFLGVSQKLVSLIECGKRTVNQELDLKIRRLLDINES